jgi:hypothetical protein
VCIECRGGVVGVMCDGDGEVEGVCVLGLARFSGRSQ